MIAKRLLFILIGIILFLIATNPTYTNFKEFLGASDRLTDLQRNSNFLIFSIYEDKENNEKYIGVIKNFIEIKKDNSITSNSVVVDSANSDPLHLIDSAKSIK